LSATVDAEYPISCDCGIAGDRECLHSAFWFCEWQGVRKKIFELIRGIILLYLLLRQQNSGIACVAALNGDHRNWQWLGLQISLTSQCTENTVDRYILMVF